MSSTIQFVNNPNICCLDMPTTTEEEPGTARVQKWLRAISRAGTGGKIGQVWTMLRTWERQAPYDNGHIEIDDKTVVSKIVEQMEELQIPVPQDLTEGPDLEPPPPSRAYQTDLGPAPVPPFMAPIVARAHASANPGPMISRLPLASAYSEPHRPAFQGAPIGTAAA
ncbi:hypothetical protein CBER1_07979 [Cercospora berteroae]|uniref:Uncharacterized protein n=1 Tax=Cercospora berteroae TaxID=357750 RepID=A0A2S6BVH8_9PEZI|nr:hypothetical protein CBER1_07979 [Cercospora berteroae]